jgi:parvulin-like peptidyl-prolyl isomerase
MVQLLVEQIQAGILPESVSDADARAYYDGHPSEFEAPERLRVSHILIAVPQNASPQVREAQRAKAQEVLDLLKKGADFATLARQRSNDTSTAANGGKLPDFAKGTFAPPFESAAFALKPGALSGLVETAYGYHIIKLHERVPARKAPYEEVAQRLKAFLVQQKRIDATNQLVGQLRAKAKIEILI